MQRLVWQVIGSMLLLAPASPAQSSFRIATVAGARPTGDGGLATAAALGAIEGLAVDAGGDIYLAETTNHRVRRVDRQGLISTVAGNGSPGFRGDGEMAARAVLNSPYGIAVHPAGGLLVADFGNRRIRRVAASGSMATAASGVELLGPRNVAADTGGNLFVSDYLGHQIYRVAADGGKTVLAGPTAQLSYPTGLAVDRGGVVYFADSGNKSIRRIAGGQVTTVLGGLGTPTGLALDRDGNLYIADPSERRLIRMAANGTVTTLVNDAEVHEVAVDSTGAVYYAAGRQVMRLTSGGAAIVVAGSGVEPPAALQGPIGVAVDLSDNLYIAEEKAGRIRRVSPSGAIQTIAGGGSSLGDGGLAIEARLVDPVAVAWHPVAGLRVVDHLGHRVRGVLSSNGKIYTVAGDGQAGFGGDSGPASQARLNRPRGAAFDRDGNLFVADSANHRIRRIGANGFISTVSGTGALNAPLGVAVDSADVLYIADTGNNLVRRLSPDGVLSTVAGTGVQGYAGDGGPAVAAALNAPVALAVDASDRLLIADTFNHRVRRVAANGVIETIAGDGSPGFSGDDGPAALAQLNAPAGLAVDSAGRIYVADLDNGRVRRLDPLSAPDEAVAPVIPDSPGLSKLIVMNAASLQPGPISPGMLVSLFADPLGPGPDAQVRIGGILASIVYAGPGQFNVEASRTLTPKAGLLVEALLGGRLLATAQVEVAATQPALFTVAQGLGQAVVLNEDGSLNSVDRPAARGSIVTLFGTGEGVAADLLVRVQVGSAQAEVLSAGRAPESAGLFEIKVRLPGVFTPPGVRPLALSIGSATSQPGVTIAVN